jgi:hypothetical protein
MFEMWLSVTLIKRSEELRILKENKNAIKEKWKGIFVDNEKNKLFVKEYS